MLPYDPRFEQIDRMTGGEFEAALTNLFEGQGYGVRRNGGYRDKGVDLIVNLDDVATAVQAKRWSSAVGLDCIHTLFAGKARHDCGHAIAVTTHFLTRPATEAADELGIELWDRWRLSEFLPGDPPEIDRTTCAECGAKVKPGVVQFCLSDPARFDGNVYCPYHQKKRNRAA
jgi:restriction system protein